MGISGDIDPRRDLRKETAETKGEPENPEAHAIILEVILMLLLFFLQT